MTGRVSAAASLPYYVMTGVCLLLGTVGLALPEAEADRLAGRRVTAAVAVSVMVTLVRFGLEQAAAPASWTRVVGIADLAPVVGAYFALDLMAEKSRVRAFFLALLVYALAVRAWVALFYLAATSLRLGSHLDLSSVESVTVPFVGECRFEPGSLEQLLNLAILPQLTFWPLFTVLAGPLAGARVLASWATAGSAQAGRDHEVRAAGRAEIPGCRDTSGRSKLRGRPQRWLPSSDGCRVPFLQSRPSSSCRTHHRSYNPQRQRSRQHQTT